MQAKHLTSVVVAGLFLLGACAHHKDVRPGANGQNRVVTQADTAEGATRSALAQSNHYCEEFKKTPKVVSETVVYTGEMDESTRKTVRKASQAAILVGGMNTQPGSTGVNPVLGAGQVGSVMTGGDDYKAEMVFLCQ